MAAVFDAEVCVHVCVRGLLLDLDRVCFIMRVCRGVFSIRTPQASLTHSEPSQFLDFLCLGWDLSLRG